MPSENFISVRICKKVGVYKAIPIKKFIDILRKCPFDVDLEYRCDFADSKMLTAHSNLLDVSAEIFIEEIKNTEYACE